MLIAKIKIGQLEVTMVKEANDFDLDDLRKKYGDHTVHLIGGLGLYQVLGRENIEQFITNEMILEANWIEVQNN